MIDVRRLRLLAELDARGTIAAVGVALHLSAPGVSTQLSALERQVGVALTEKDGRKVRLTPTGRRLAAQARIVLDQLDSIESEVIAAQEGRLGTFRVGAFPSAARTILADTWRTLIASRSSVTVTLTECEPEEAISALVRADIEMAITHSYSNIPRAVPNGIDAMPLATETVWLALPDGDSATPRGGVRSVDLRAVAQHAWLVPHSTWSCHEMVQRACGTAGFVPRVVAQATDFSVLLELVAAGAGVALLPELTIEHVPRGVRLYPTRQPILRHDFLLTRTAAGVDPGLILLQDQLRQSANRVMAARQAKPLSDRT